MCMAFAKPESRHILKGRFDMTTFGCNTQIIKTRKPHTCLICNRIIPKGFRAYHTGGMWQGDWQNWYCCTYCHNEVIDFNGEEVGEQDFTDYVYELSESHCPDCKGKYGDIDFDISEDSDVIKFTCNDCGRTWTHQIYGIETNIQKKESDK